MEEYSSGRRGVTRNLVGLLQGARVQIPSPPPKRHHPTKMVSFLYLHLDIYHFPRLLVDFLSCNIYNNSMM